MRVFSSGSCRLLAVINDGYNKIIPIHSQRPRSIGPGGGINFLGKIHNIKQHIQFIQFIFGEIILPENITYGFLSAYMKGHTYREDNSGLEDASTIPTRIEIIRSSFNNCDTYIFEICSLKLYIKDSYQVDFHNTYDYNVYLQNEDDLYNDLCILINMLPISKKIIFQCHFRPNIIENNIHKTINNREIIFRVLTKISNIYSNVKIYDPSELLKNKPYLYDGDIHFKDEYYEEIFNYLYDNYISN